MARENSKVTLRNLIGGAVYDFAAGLTCRKEPITLGAVHNAAPAAEACQDFLKQRGCAEGEPLVKGWQDHLDATIGVTPTVAMQTLKGAMKEDYNYAWSWHCNIAMAAQDEGMDHAAANRAAARFMLNAFDIDTSKEPSHG